MIEIQRVSTGLVTLATVAMIALAGGAGCGGGPTDGPLTLASGKVVSAQTLKQGRQTFGRYCASCHGHDGKGETPAGKNLDPMPRDFTQANFKHMAATGNGLPTDEELRAVVKNGVPGTGMPAWPNLTDAEVQAVIDYIKVFSPRWRGDATQKKPSDQGGVRRGASTVLPNQSVAVKRLTIE